MCMWEKIAPIVAEDRKVAEKKKVRKKDLWQIW